MFTKIPRHEWISALSGDDGIAPYSQPTSSEQIKKKMYIAIHQYEHSFRDIIWTRNQYQDRMSHYGKFVPCKLFKIYQDPMILIKLGLICLPRGVCQFRSINLQLCHHLIISLYKTLCKLRNCARTTPWVSLVILRCYMTYFNTNLKIDIFSFYRILVIS